MHRLTTASLIDSTVRNFFMYLYTTCLYLTHFYDTLERKSTHRNNFRKVSSVTLWEELIKFQKIKKFTAQNVIWLDAGFFRKVRTSEESWTPKSFLSKNDVQIILNRSNIEICEHSSFFNYRRNYFWNEVPKFKK